MESHLSISEVKNRLTAILHDIEAGNSVTVTRHGKPVAVMLSLEEYERLSGNQKDFWESYTAFRQDVCPEDLIQDDSVFENLRDRSGGRDLDFG